MPLQIKHILSQTSVAGGTRAPLSPLPQLVGRYSGHGIVSNFSATLFKIGSPFSHIPGISTTTSCNPLFRSVFAPSKASAAVHTTYAKPEPVSPRSSSSASIHRQSERSTPRRTPRAWSTSGIHPDNLDAVVQQPLQKLEQSRGSFSRGSSDGWYVQRLTSTPSEFLAWKTPRNRPQLRQQTSAAICTLSIGQTWTACAIALCKLSRQTEAAFARAEIAE